MNKLSFEERLSRGEKIIQSNVGDSMMPLLRQGRDLMVIEPRPEKCKRLDAVLYRRPNGKYVMHRILKVRKDGYVLCGDNRWMREFGVPDEWIIGILTGVLRDGKKLLTVDSFRYRVYVHLWCDFYWIRAFLLRVRGNLRKLKRKKK
jgi:hypothetical protein